MAGWLLRRGPHEHEPRRLGRRLHRRPGRAVRHARDEARGAVLQVSPAPSPLHPTPRPLPLAPPPAPPARGESPWARRGAGLVAALRCRPALGPPPTAFPPPPSPRFFPPIACASGGRRGGGLEQVVRGAEGVWRLSGRASRASGSRRWMVFSRGASLPIVGNRRWVFKSAEVSAFQS